MSAILKLLAIVGIAFGISLYLARKPKPQPVPLRPDPVVAQPNPVEKWNDFTPGQVVSIGDVSISLIEARVGLVDLTTGFGGATSTDPELQITYYLGNSSKTRKLECQSWGNSPFVARGRSASDDLGNQYRGINYGISKPSRQQESSFALYPEKEVIDCIVIEPPVAAAKYVRLELDGANVGQDGQTLRLQIPVASIIRK